MKKAICLFMALILSIGMLSSCGKKEITSALYNPDAKVGDTGGLELPLADGTQEIHWSVSSTVDTINTSYVANKLREYTGVNVQLDVYPTGSAGEKIKVLAASKKLPDIVGQGLDTTFAEDLCNQGAFVAVEDYIDILPNFKRTFVDNEENNWIFKSYSAADGKLYGFYGWDWNRDINHGMLYRKDIFDKHGIEMWNSPETFYEAMKKLKELYPDSYPFVSKNGTSIFNKLGSSWGILAQNPYYDEKSKIWKYSDTTEEYKELLDFLKKLYNEGLIDPEFITATQAAWTTKMTQADKAFVTFDWIGRLEQFKTQTAETVPSYDLRFGSPIGPDQTYPSASQLCWPRYVSDNDNAETSFKLLDFCLSPAGKELITMGEEGDTYTIDGEGKVSYIGFEGKNPEMTDLEEKYGMYVSGMYLSFDRRSSYFQFSEREQEAQDFASKEGNTSPLDPILVFTNEEKEKNNDILPELQKSGLEFSTQYILGNGGDKEWNEWLAKAEKLGYKEIEKIYNDAQKRYDAK